MMLPDYHIHTVLCKHASGDAEDYRNAARERDFKEICIADHAPAPDGYDPRHRMAMHEFEDYKHMVLPLKNSSCPRILFGIEADYYEGAREFLGQWLPAQSFDLVLGSVHYIENWGFDNPEERSVWDAVDVAGTWKAYFRLLMALAETRMYDVVSHLDLPKKFGHRPPDRVTAEMAKPALDAIADAGMAIEINTSGLRSPVKEIYPSPTLLGLAKERSIPICFGSDSHGPETVGYRFDEALKLAREAGYGEAVSFSERRQRPYVLPFSS